MACNRLRMEYKLSIKQSVDTGQWTYVSTYYVTVGNVPSVSLKLPLTTFLTYPRLNAKSVDFGAITATVMALCSTRVHSVAPSK